MKGVKEAFEDDVLRLHSIAVEFTSGQWARGSSTVVLKEQMEADFPLCVYGGYFSRSFSEVCRRDSILFLNGARNGVLRGGSPMNEFVITRLLAARGPRFTTHYISSLHPHTWWGPEELLMLQKRGLEGGVSGQESNAQKSMQKSNITSRRSTLMPEAAREAQKPEKQHWA